MGKKRKTRGTGRGRQAGRARAPKRGTRRGAARRERRGARFLDVVIVAMLFLAAYFAVLGGEYSVFEIRQLEALEEERAAELARTEAEIDSLEAIAQHLERDPAAIERVARERYGMIREGEILYRFRESAPRDTSRIDGAGEGQ